MARRPAIFAALILGIGLGWWAIARAGIGLEDLRALVATLDGWRAAEPFAATLAAFAIYVAVTALSLPLGIWMTLGIGALFGFWWGLAIVSFASTLGASLAFLSARHLMRDWARARLGGRLEAIDRGLARDGELYLLTLRLVPAVPFFAVNLAMGLTAMPLGRFWRASQIGMLPGTAIYVNAGTELAGLRAVGDIASPGMIGALVALGVFPWIARWGVGWLRLRRLRARWPRPGRFERNLVVIGAGAAGLVAAYMAATLRARVTLIEEAEMGGDCLNTGCVPSKTLIRSGRAAAEVRRAADFGIRAGLPETDWPAVTARIRAAIAAIAPNDSAERYRGLGVEVLTGRARIIDPWHVEVETAEGIRRLSTRAIVIATGAAPAIPPVPGLVEAGCLTSETIWTRLADPAGPPRRLAILGAGPIGCELAQALARLGLGVVLIEAAARILPREDAEAAAIAAAALRADGVEIRTTARLRAVSGAPGDVTLALEDGTTIRAEAVLAATGRRARLKGLGLEELGIATDGPRIETDAFMRTLHPNILAAGDVVGPAQFTHAAAQQGWGAAVNALFGGIVPGVRGLRVAGATIPAVTFTDPEIARAGLTEEEARARGIAHEVTRHDLSHLDRAIADGVQAGFVKVITAGRRGRILGVSIVAPHAGEMLAPFLLAMQARMGLGRMLATVLPYPTYAEAGKFAAGTWRKGRTNPRALGLLGALNRWRRGGGDD
ncbi:MAG: FAD-dependent oxidoreductase [Gemmobacter sp.]